jgi:spore photoproduct lyase
MDLPLPTDAELSPPAPSPRPVRPHPPWVPRRVLVTPAALGWPQGAAMVERAAALGAEIVRLKADRLSGLPDTYKDAKTTMAVVAASPSRRRPQPIPPSADWRFDVAEGCPAHCQYCYLAGSLAGPPIIRAYANLPEILSELPPLLGKGGVTSTDPARAAEGTTFEASCYTDPLGVEHITGALAEAIRFFGTWDLPAGQGAQLRFTTKYDAIEPLLDLPHNRRTRIRFSVNSRAAERFEGGAPRMPLRLAAMRKAALAGYRIGLTVAPIMPRPDWEAEYNGCSPTAPPRWTAPPPRTSRWNSSPTASRKAPSACWKAGIPAAAWTWTRPRAPGKRPSSAALSGCSRATP